jgi:galactokinase
MTSLPHLPEAPDFRSLFGRSPEARAEAPGRVNLIGEHTDYNGGYVLPMAIPQRTRVELAPRADRTVRAWSAGLSGDAPPRTYDLGAERPEGDWLDYIQGVTQALRADGQPLRGFDLRIASDVPVGAGLSSSAALEVSLARGLRALFALELDDVRLALAGQRAENAFVGARVGVMDQMAASLADEATALFLDTRSLDFERVPLPAEAAIAVISSGVTHQHAGGEYNQRRRECEAACVRLGIAQLRDLLPDDLPRLAALPEPLARRARHVVTENARVLEAVRALRRADAPELGRLFFASHASMRDDYEVSIPEIDLLVELGRADPEVHGARLTGGGFGGSVVFLTRAGAAPAAAARIARGYTGQCGRRPAVLVPVGSGAFEHRY